MNTASLAFIGTQEIIIIVVIILLLFGGKKIPELMRGLGRGVKEFKEGQKEEPTADDSDVNHPNHTGRNDSVNTPR